MKTAEEQIEGVVNFIRDVVCNEPLILFHQDSLFARFPESFTKQLGADGQSLKRLKPVLENAVKVAETQCSALHVKLRDSLYGMDIMVKADGEWETVRQWAFQAPDASPLILSRPASELIDRIKNGNIGNEFISEMSLRRRIRYYGYFSSLDDLVEEIRLKRGAELRIEVKGDRYGAQKNRFLKISIERSEPIPSPDEALNPEIPESIINAPDPERQFRRWFYRLLLETRSNESAPILIWSISTRQNFFRCFPWLKGEEIRAESLIPWLQAVRQNGILNVGWNLDRRSHAWTISVHPHKSWSDSKVTLHQELERKTAEEEFGLSAPAAALFEWLRSIPKGQLELGLTPIVEEAIAKKELLLKSPWEAGNSSLYLRILCDEIAAKAQARYEAVHWHTKGETLTRILDGQFFLRA